MLESHCEEDRGQRADFGLGIGLRAWSMEFKTRGQKSDGRGQIADCGPFILNFEILPYAFC